jgi:hypothetical protein
MLILTRSEDEFLRLLTTRTIAQLEGAADLYRKGFLPAGTPGARRELGQIEAEIASRPRCGIWGCVLPEGHRGAPDYGHVGRSCGHESCADRDGHIDECRARD